MTSYETAMTDVQRFELFARGQQVATLRGTEWEVMYAYAIRAKIIAALQAAWLRDGGPELAKEAPGLFRALLLVDEAQWWIDRSYIDSRSLQRAARELTGIGRIRMGDNSPRPPRKLGWGDR